MSEIEAKLHVLEHASDKYPPRTYHNATTSNLTIALAVDYSSAGERLTHKAAGENYLALPLYGETRNPIKAAKLLYKTLRDRQLEHPVINVAGNSILTLKAQGYTQEAINLHVALLLGKVHMHWPIGKILSGGQTGADLAGAVAARVIGIEAEMMLPRGFLQRHEDGRDRPHTENEIQQQVIDGAAQVRTMIHAIVQPTPAAALSESTHVEPAPVLGGIRVVSKRQGGTPADPGETVIDGDRKHPVFGNRHYLSNWRDPEERSRVIEKHLKEDFEPDILEGGAIYREMQKLAERVCQGERIALACWCKPLPCHCDPIADGILKLSQGIDLQAEIRAQVQARVKKNQEAKAGDYTYTFFFGHKDPFSNWHPSKFKADGHVFHCNEQFLMFKKAQLFGDKEMALKILEATNPRDCKALGRAVRGFDESVWVAHREAIMKEGLMAKFSQNPKLKADLLSTGLTKLVEASPYDRIWGIGLSMDNPDAKDPSKWKGLNLLGKALTEVKIALRQDRACDTQQTQPVSPVQSAPATLRNAGFPVFVFGSNLAGRHGKGAAKDAVQHYGAQYGKGVGRQGLSYAIPTKDERLKALPLETIKEYVQSFLEYARANPNENFLVTPIGTGLAGYSHDEIAPFFKGAPDNCLLPGAWQPSNIQRIIIAGSRSLKNETGFVFDTMDARLKEIRATHGTNVKIEVVSGGAPGIDRIGEAWAKSRGLDCIRFPADWDRLSKRSGMIRNRSLACYGNSLELFWDGVSPGSRDMAALCEQEGIKARVHERQPTPELNERPQQRAEIIRRSKP